MTDKDSRSSLTCVVGINQDTNDETRTQYFPCLLSSIHTTSLPYNITESADEYYQGLGVLFTSACARACKYRFPVCSNMQTRDSGISSNAIA